ncbi:hypothetical protein NEOLEDRAFT_1052965 [Neolentinus lepideus HHB14362 ss-1]|uniref:Elongator complex protein 5 n=1 Tax=Neolentinus lepideus HHB14362 ss-1 TaxID=1314782 RepID=A0A165W7Q2_9AGAM|nr:hypothetical protein NEOLEDRAFT_1052965 [Neolentinus lepideus HHB14362 ss-1]
MATFPPPDLLSSRQVVIVTDQILSPANFLLHRTLASHFKDHKDARCIVLLVSESISRWNAIASRATVNLAALIESQALRFLDMVKDIQPHLGTDDSTRSTLIRSLLQEQGDAQADQPTLILLDDISTLEWMGYATNELVKFLRALSILARKGNASLVVRHHVITPDTPDVLFRFLLQLCTYHIDVRPLSSGRSGAVNGEISLYRGPSNGTAHVKTTPRQRAVQYRLTDATAVYFEKGTGQAVL